MRNKEIIEHCKRAGGQSALARLIGVDPRTVRRWVSGESAPRGMSRRTLENIKEKISIDA